MFEKSIYAALKHEENNALFKLRHTLDWALFDSRFNKGVVSESVETRLEKQETSMKRNRKLYVSI